MLFGLTARNEEVLEFYFEGEKIELVKSVKFLGLHIDSSLNWKDEVSRIEAKISSACYALRTLRDELTIKQLLSVYYALVESHFRYSIKFWGKLTISIRHSFYK